MSDPKHVEKSAEQTQNDRFIEVARAIGCDETEATFDEKLKGIARQKPKGKPERPKSRADK